MEKKFWLVGLVVWFLLWFVLPILMLISGGATLRWPPQFTPELEKYLARVEKFPGVITGESLVHILQIAVIGWITFWIWKRYKKSKGESVRSN